jgi:hypothetical protein
MAGRQRAFIAEAHSMTAQEPSHFVMKNFSFHVAAVDVTYQENIPEAKAMQDAFDQLKQTNYGEHIMDELEIQGVTEFGDSGIIVSSTLYVFGQVHVQKRLLVAMWLSA